MYWRLSNNFATSTYRVHIYTLGSIASYRGNKTNQTNQPNKKEILRRQVRVSFQITIQTGLARYEQW